MSTQPTLKWSLQVETLLLVIRYNNAEGKKHAHDEFRKMAAVADLVPDLLSALTDAAAYMAEMGHPEETLAKARKAIAQTNALNQ